MALKKAEAGTLQIDALKQGRVKLRLIGTTPLFMNNMALKVKRDLLIGGGKKTAAQKRAIKHDPESEFRSSAHKKADGETLLCFPAPGVKAAMATAALETAGVTKTSVQRLIFLPEQKIQIWGKPYLKMDVVRSADINRTPDIRSRCYLPRWVAEVTIAFIMPTLSTHAIVSLLSNAGVIIGLGDFRQEKGRGSYGTFAVGGDDLAGWQDYWDSVTQEARSVQQAALDNPECADEDTAELMGILDEERARRAL